MKCNSACQMLVWQETIIIFEDSHLTFSQFSCSVMSDSWRPHGMPHPRPPCPITNSRSLFKFMSIELAMPSNHLILCPLLLLPPSIFPSIRVFSNDSVLRIGWPKYWSFSFSISPSNEYSGLISFRMDWLDLLASHLGKADSVFTNAVSLVLGLHWTRLMGETELNAAKNGYVDLRKWQGEKGADSEDESRRAEKEESDVCMEGEHEPEVEKGDGGGRWGGTRKCRERPGQCSCQAQRHSRGEKASEDFQVLLWVVRSIPLLAIFETLWFLFIFIQWLFAVTTMLPLNVKCPQVSLPTTWQTLFRQSEEKGRKQGHKDPLNSDQTNIGQQNCTTSASFISSL